MIMFRALFLPRYIIADLGDLTGLISGHLGRGRPQKLGFSIYDTFRA